MSSPCAFQPNDRVKWHNDTTKVYGYGTFSPIPARVVKLGVKRVQIEFKFKRPFEREALWQSDFKWVVPHSLTPRALPCAAFGEKMEYLHEGFLLTGWKHPNGRSSVFPKGIWYPAVDGYTCGGPCSSEERAVQDALQCLLNGNYRTALVSAIDVREHWIASGTDKDGVRAAELPTLRDRLLKVEGAFPPQLAM